MKAWELRIETRKSQICRRRVRHRRRVQAHWPSRHPRQSTPRRRPRSHSKSDYSIVSYCGPFSELRCFLSLHPGTVPKWARRVHVRCPVSQSTSLTSRSPAQLFEDGSFMMSTDYHLHLEFTGTLSSEAGYRVATTWHRCLSHILTATTGRRPSKPQLRCCCEYCPSIAPPTPSRLGNGSSGTMTLRSTSPLRAGALPRGSNVPILLYHFPQHQHPTAVSSCTASLGPDDCSRSTAIWL